MTAGGIDRFRSLYYAGLGEMRRILLTSLMYGLVAQEQPAGGLLRHLSVANLKGSGSNEITTMKTDAEGNIYVAGKTSSFDFTVKNAAQPAIGEKVLLRSTDRGLTWTALPVSADSGEVLAFAAHPRDPLILIQGTPKGIEKSIDGGRTWRRTYFSESSLANSYPIVFDPANPSKIYAAGAGMWNYFVVSNDGGESWRQRYAPEGAASSGLWVDPTGTGSILMGRFLSRDQGASWTAIQLPESRYTATALDPRRRGWIFAHTSVGAAGVMHLSTDWGVTWTERSLPVRTSGFRPSIERLIFDPDVAGTLYALDVSGERHVSTDDGLTWRSAGPPEASRDVVTLSRRCGGGGLFSSTASYVDFGETPRAQLLPRIQRLAHGPDCSLYAIRKATSDAFAAKWSPNGRDLLWATFLGGMEGDEATAIALDPAGNVYVGGSTASPEFLGAHPHVTGSSRSVFVAKLGPDGRPLYSAFAGGERTDWPTGLAVSDTGEAYLAGWTDSRSFPTTPGAALSIYPGSGAAFVVKFGSDGVLEYATYLEALGAETRTNSGMAGGFERRVAAAVAPDGAVLVGGFAGMLVRLSSDGSAATRLPTQPGRVLVMDRGANGEIFVAGARQNGTRSTNCASGTGFGGVTIFTLASDVFVRRVSTGDGSTLWQAELNGSCASWAETIAISPTGDVTLGIFARGAFPLAKPLLLHEPCGGRIVAKLSVEGGRLLQSTPTDECTRPVLVAHSPDGGVYMATNRLGTGVLRIPKAESREIQIDGVVDALSGVAGHVTPGRLLFLATRGLTEEIADVGLNHPGPLPLELDGVQVYMDDEPVGILRISPSSVICSVPRDLSSKQSVFLRISNRNGSSSEPLVLPAGPFASTSLLTKVFPELPSPNAAVDLNVRNADGTLNSASNPAAIGSTVTLFATGVPEDRLVALIWNPPPPQRVQLVRPLYAQAEPMPGFIEGLWAVRFRIPDAAGLGVDVAPTPGVLSRAVINGYGIYIK